MWANVGAHGRPDAIDDGCRPQVAREWATDGERIEIEEFTTFRRGIDLLEGAVATRTVLGDDQVR